MTNDEYLRSLTPEELAAWFDDEFQPKKTVSESCHAANDPLAALAEIRRLKGKVARLEDANAILAEQLRVAIDGWHEANRGWAEALMRR